MERLAANGPFAPGAPPVPSGKGREVRGAPIQAETLARLDAFRDRASRGDSAGQPDGDVFEPIAALMARFRETSDPADQEEIIRSLAHREESEGRKLLLEAALGDGTPEVRMAALEALAEAPREEDLVAVVAALDAVLGGLRALLDGIFDDKVFVVSFLSNVVIAAAIVFLGDKLGVGGQLSTGVIVVLGIRIFSNVAAIRRHLLRA